MGWRQRRRSEWQGVGFTYWPGKHDPQAQTDAWDRDLDVDLRILRDWGTNSVVRLIETHEREPPFVPEHGEGVERTGLRWWHLPIVEGSGPDERFGHAWNRAGRACAVA